MAGPAGPPPWEKIIASYAYNPDGAGAGAYAQKSENRRKKRSALREKKTKPEKEKKSRARTKRKKIVVISPYFASSAQKLIQIEAEKGNTVDVVVCRRSKTKRRKNTGDPCHLTAAEKLQDAYERVSGDTRWIPPFSDHDLLQEFHFFDHWRVLVICMLLNRTTGRQVKFLRVILFFSSLV